MELTKICSKCGFPKLLKEFYKAKECRLGVMAECKDCHRQRGKAKAQEPKVRVTTKECSKCQAIKVSDEFYKWSRSKDGLQTECKDCHNGRNPGNYPRDETIGEKPCTKCGITKMASEFYDNPYATNGMDSWCKECRKTDNAAWNKNNPEKRKPIANRSAKKARGIPEKRAIIYAKTRRWQLAHPEAVKIHGRRDREKARSNPSRMEKRRQTTMQWFVDHPGYRRAASQRRRALLRGAHITDSFIDIAILYERDHGICTLCHYAVDARLTWPDKRIPTIDHYIPVTRGGDHGYANTKLAHHYCNTLKNNRLETPELLASTRVRFALRYGVPGEQLFLCL
jgi:HNH endonuclease